MAYNLFYKNMYVIVFSFIVLLGFLANNANAYGRIPLTVQEYRTWPIYCLATEKNDDREAQDRYLTRHQKVVAAQTGIWHYCLALIYVQRSERGEDILDERAINDLFYSYDKIPKSEPWARDMEVTIARAFRIKGDYEKAEHYLEIARAKSPDMAIVYSVLSSLHFDRLDYHQAVKVLEAGNEATEGTSAEINYFLGLAYLSIGNIDKAKKQEDIASSLGYPLKGLAKKIDEYERENISVNK